MQVKEITIKIFESVGDTAAVSSEDGDILFGKLREALKNGVTIKLDFSGLELITSTFLDASIGQMLK